MFDFTFIVLTYNHEKFIIEHLESIKFLIENYGEHINCELIVADDASKDNTVKLVNAWLKINANLFVKATILSDGINKGTCKNFTSATHNLTTHYCKVTAGDDVYSYENLFDAYRDVDNYHLISGVPLSLLNGKILPSYTDLFNFIASDIVYSDFDYSERLMFVYFFNAPNFLHNVKLLKNQEISDFVNQFSVTEDYPFLIKASEVFYPLKFKQNLKTYVYYRRTSNSTYIIKNDIFTKDKVAIFSYLIDKEKNLLKRYILRSRLYCFGLKNRYLGKALNLGIYSYGTLIIANLHKIYPIFRRSKQEINAHQAHYNAIVESSKSINRI